MLLHVHLFLSGRGLLLQSCKLPLQNLGQLWHLPSRFYLSKMASVWECNFSQPKNQVRTVTAPDFISKSKVGMLPHFFISLFAVSSFPIGTDSCNMLGIVRESFVNFSSILSCSSSNFLRLSETVCI